MRWVSNDQLSTIPQGAVMCGHDEDGNPFYIAKIYHKVGFYDPRQTQSVYASYPNPTIQSSTHWKFLVITYRESLVR